MYQTMPENFQAYEKVIEFDGFYMEMTKEEASVLSGLIEIKKPKKIVEIGCAAGGSTCLIMKTLEMLGCDKSEVISVDLNEYFYRDTDKCTGWLLDYNKEKFANYSNHKFLLGKLAVDRLKEIGKDVDFLFLDTVHALPGEVLDFLLLFPYLSKGAMVVLHDTNIHNKFWRNDCISNRVLFNSVVADKFYKSEMEYLNIGAFCINDDTEKYIENVFFSLLLPWRYYNSDEIMKYRKAFADNYSDFHLTIFDSAVNAHKEARYSKVIQGIDSATKRNKKVLVYGCGSYGTKLIKYIKSIGRNIDGVVVSDSIDIQACEGVEEMIYHYSDIPYDVNECVFVIATTSSEVQNLLRDSSFECMEIGDFYNYL